MSAGGENSELVDQFHEFYSRYCEDDLVEMATGDRESLQIDYGELFQFDQTLAEDYINEPEAVREYAELAAEQYDLPHPVQNATVHLSNIDEDLVHTVGEMPVDKEKGVLGSVRGIRGQVSQQTMAQPVVTEAAFECQRCGTMTYIPQDGTGGKLQEPHECKACERQGPFKIDLSESDRIPYQRVRVQAPPESSEGGDGTDSIDVHLKGDLVKSASSGNRVTIASRIEGRLLSEGQKKTQRVELYGDAEDVTVEDADWDDADLGEHEERIREIATSDNPFDKIVNSIKPSHHGDELVKLAIALQMFQGVWKELPDGSTIRGTIHLFLIGDPGTDKSGLLNYAKKITPGAIYTDGSGSTNAGLTAAAIQSDFADGGWTIKGGTLVQANNSLACVDELDDMEEEDRSGMKESMASGTISVSKAGMTPTLPARTSVLAAANPKYGRYDRYQPIGEQIDLHPALLSRFDLIFPLIDKPDEEGDRKMADHINDMNHAGQQIARGEDLSDDLEHDSVPDITPEVMRAYVAYARENVHPELTEDAKARLKEEYVQVRLANYEQEDTPVPTTARSLLALHRLAEASARIRLSERVEVEDAERIIKIWRKCLSEIGVDPETGEFDADVVETGTSKTQSDRKKTIKRAIAAFEDEDRRGAPMDLVYESCEQNGIPPEKVDEEIEKFKRIGVVMTPGDCITLTD